MEKVLRKVKCGERLPEIYGYYYTSIGEMFYRNEEFRYNDHTPENQPEYWYEEVSLEELITGGQCSLKEIFSNILFRCNKST